MPNTSTDLQWLLDMDLKIDPATNDISLTQGLVDTVTAANLSKAQRIRSRLMTIRGEWFLDTTFGLDYYGVVWVKGTPREVLAAHVKREILREADAGDKITSFEMDYVGSTRTLTVTAKLQNADGTSTSVSI